MAEDPDEDVTPSQPAPEDMNWAISYLREDIQDLRMEIRGQLQEVRHEAREFRQEFLGLLQEAAVGRKELSQRMDAIDDRYRRELNTRFYWLIGLIFLSWLSTMTTLLIKL